MDEVAWASSRWRRSSFRVSGRHRVTQTRRFWRPFTRASARRFSRSWSRSVSSRAAGGIAARTAARSPRQSAPLVGRSSRWSRCRSCWEAGSATMARAWPWLRTPSSRCLVLSCFPGLHRRATAGGPGGPLVPVGTGARACWLCFSSFWESVRSSRCCLLTDTPRTVTFYQAVTRTAHQTSGALLAGGGRRFQSEVFPARGQQAAFLPEGGGSYFVS